MVFVTVVETIVLPVAELLNGNAFVATLASELVGAAHLAIIYSGRNNKANVRYKQVDHVHTDALHRHHFIALNHITVGSLEVDFFLPVKAADSFKQ